MPKKFIRKKEDFVCENCGAEVVGDGYTNHCPKCLWSKHVDINPGDRLDECGGLMQPIDVYYEHQNWILVHKCRTCGAVRRNRADNNDDAEALIKLQQDVRDRKMQR